jgi:hypothetical protein
MVAGIIQISRAIRGTTLTTAVCWAWAAAAAFAGSLTSAVFAHFPESLAQQSFFWTGIVALCPLIAVLGAQRPGVRVWNSFILVPLMFVLGWPALTVWFGGYPLAPLQIETPTAVGIAIVALMGLGNYLLIPRWTLSALFYGAAIAFIVLPLTTFGDIDPRWHLAAYPSLGLSALAGWLTSRKPQTHPDPLDQMWSDFRDRFGLVWAVRIKERVNATAQKERWCWVLEMQGFRKVDVEGALSELETRTRADHTLRWLLRRFVDEQSSAGQPGESKST